MSNENGIPSLPVDSLLQRIYEYAFSKTKAPAGIIFWTVFALLGACLRDKIYIDWATKTIFPNFPLLIVAPSGWGKTGAVNACMNIFDGVLPYTIPEDSTAESFTSQFSKYSVKGNFATCVLWVVPELADIFGKKSYQEGLIARLTRLLDAPKDRKVSRKNQDDETIWGRAVFNWISCTTFIWLAENVDVSVSTGGFLPRVFTVKTEEPPRKNTNPVRDHAKEEALNKELKKAVGHLKSTPLAITPDIEAILDQNYKDHMESIGTELENFIARRDENFLRIYLVLRVFGGITEHDGLLRLSYGCCKFFENNNLTLLRDINNNKNRNKNFTTKSHDRVIKKFRNSVIRKKPEHFYAQVCRDLNLHSDELKAILTDLAEKGCIEWNKATGTHGKILVLESINDFK